MPFEVRAFQLAKDPEHPAENQDAFAFDSDQGIAAVADGVASAIFSGVWAETLVQATVRQPPDPDNPIQFAAWLAECRRQWTERIDTTGLAWFQKAKLPTGAFSTLLWMQLFPLESEQAGSFGGFRLLARAIGDSCLFHVRHGELLRSFPMASAAEFENNPLALGSVDLGRDSLMRFATFDVTCYPDDLLLLTTDAVGEWLYRCVEAGAPPVWSTLWETDATAWGERMDSLRATRDMRYDDATLLALQITNAADRGAKPEQKPEQKPDAPVSDVSSPTKAALDQIADGFGQLADESIRAGQTLFNRLRDRFRNR